MAAKKAAGRRPILRMYVFRMCFGVQYRVRTLSYCVSPAADLLKDAYT